MLLAKKAPDIVLTLPAIQLEQNSREFFADDAGDIADYCTKCYPAYHDFTSSNSAVSGAAAPFAGTFQYGLLHEPQRTGTTPLRGFHPCPHRQQLQGNTVDGLRITGK